MKNDNKSYPHVLAAGIQANDETIAGSLAAKIVRALMDNGGVEVQLYPSDISALIPGTHQTTVGKEAKLLASHGILKVIQAANNRKMYQLSEEFFKLFFQINRGREHVEERAANIVHKAIDNVDWRDQVGPAYARRVDPVVFEHKTLFLTMDELIDFYKKVSHLLFFTPMKSFVEVSYKVKGREYTIDELNEALDAIERIDAMKDIANDLKTNLAKFVP